MTRFRRSLARALSTTLAAGGLVVIAPVTSIPTVSAANGCGAEGGVSAALVPNSISGVFNFTNACNNHDNCYASYGNGQQFCDTNFRNDMYAECSGRTLRSVCESMADLYAWAVETFGADAYQSAQEQAMLQFSIEQIVSDLLETGQIDATRAAEILQSYGITSGEAWENVWGWYNYDDYWYYDDYGYDYWVDYSVIDDEWSYAPNDYEFNDDWVADGGAEGDGGSEGEEGFSDYSAGSINYTDPCSWQLIVCDPYQDQDWFYGGGIESSWDFAYDIGWETSSWGGGGGGGGYDPYEHYHY